MTYFMIVILFAFYTFPNWKFCSYFGPCHSCLLKLLIWLSNGHTKTKADSHQYLTFSLVKTLVTRSQRLAHEQYKTEKINKQNKPHLES